MGRIANIFRITESVLLEKIDKTDRRFLLAIGRFDLDAFIAKEAVVGTIVFDNNFTVF